MFLPPPRDEGCVVGIRSLGMSYIGMKEKCGG